MITGMMLLKICDPDYETPALADFSMGFSLLSLSGLITTPLTLAVIASAAPGELPVLAGCDRCVLGHPGSCDGGQPGQRRRTAPAAETATLAD